MRNKLLINNAKRSILITRMSFFLILLLCFNTLHAQQIKGQMIYAQIKKAEVFYARVYLFKEGNCIDSTYTRKGTFVFNLKTKGVYTLKYLSGLGEDRYVQVNVEQIKPTKVKLVYDELSTELQNRTNALDSMQNGDTIAVFVLINNMGEFSHFYDVILFTKPQDIFSAQICRLNHGGRTYLRLKEETLSGFRNHLANASYTTPRIQLTSIQLQKVKKFYNEVMFPIGPDDRIDCDDQFYVFNNSWNEVLLQEKEYLFYKYLQLKEELF